MMKNKKILILGITILLILSSSVILKDYIIFRVKLNSQGIDYRMRYEGMKIYLVIPDIHFSDLSALKGAPLCGLNVEDTSISDLSPLEGMKLNQIYLSNTLVTDLTPLKGMPIKEIRIWNTGISDISPIISNNLETITFGNSVYRRVMAVNKVKKEINLNIDKQTIEMVKNQTSAKYEYKSQKSYAHVKNIELLKNLKTLKTINDYSVSDFFQKIENGVYSADVSNEFLNCKKDPQYYLNNCLIWTAVNLDGKFNPETLQDIQYIELKDISTNPVGIYRLKRGETVKGITNVDFDTKTKIASIKYDNFKTEIPLGFSR